MSNHCRWTADLSEELLYVKYNRSSLNILDVNKNSFILKDPVELEKITNGNFSNITRCFKFWQ